MNYSEIHWRIEYTDPEKRRRLAWEYSRERAEELVRALREEGCIVGDPEPPYVPEKP